MLAFAEMVPFYDDIRRVVTHSVLFIAAGLDATFHGYLRSLVQIFLSEFSGFSKRDTAQKIGIRLYCRLTASRYFAIIDPLCAVITSGSLHMRPIKATWFISIILSTNPRPANAGRDAYFYPFLRFI